MLAQFSLVDAFGKFASLHPAFRNFMHIAYTHSLAVTVLSQQFFPSKTFESSHLLLLISTFCLCHHPQVSIWQLSPPAIKSTPTQMVCHLQEIQKQNTPTCCWRRTSRRSQAHLVRGALVMRSLPSPCPSNGLTWSDPGMGYGGILLIMYRFAWVGLICSHTVSTIFYAILNL